MTAWQARLRSEAVQGLSPEARHTLALEKLRDAQLRLLTAQESIDKAASESVVDLLGLSFDRGQEKQNSFGAAVRQMRAAHLLATEAAEAVQANLAITEPTALEEIALLVTLDTAWLTDGLAVNIAVHKHIRKARAQLQDMRRCVDKLLEELPVSAVKRS